MSNHNSTEQLPQSTERNNKWKERTWRFLAGTAIASSAVSMVNLVTQTETPWSLTLGGGVQEYHDYTSSIPVLESGNTTQVTTNPSVSEQNFQTSNMPFSSKFDLEQSPEAAKFTEPKGFTEYVENLKVMIDQGYQIQSIDITGYASDEALGLGATDGGLGYVNPENVQLALSRADYLRKQLQDSLSAYSIDWNTMSIGGKENVLPAGDVEQTKILAAKYGLSVEVFVYGFDHKTLELSEEDTMSMARMYDTQRGANVETTLILPGVTSEVTTDNTVCVRYDTVFAKEYKDPILPFTFIPGYLPASLPFKRRKKDESDEPDSEEPENKDEGAWAKIYAFPQRKYEKSIEKRVERRKEMNAYYQDQRELADLKRDLASSESAIRIYRDGRKSGEESPWMRKYIDEEVRKIKDINDKLDRRIAIRRPDMDLVYRKRFGGAALLVAALLAVHPHFGYCPNPEELTSNPFRLDLPEHVGVSLGIPFTDIETDELVLQDEPCPVSPAEVCEVNKIVTKSYDLNGKLITESAVQ